MITSEHLKRKMASKHRQPTIDPVSFQIWQAIWQPWTTRLLRGGPAHEVGPAAVLRQPGGRGQGEGAHRRQGLKGWL